MAVDVKELHKHNVAGKMSKSTDRVARNRILLQGTVDAMRAKLKRMVQDFKEEIDFMESNIEEMVQGVEHGVPPSDVKLPKG